MPVLARGLRWVAQLLFFQTLPACPEGRDRPAAPDGHAQQEGSCQRPARKSISRCCVTTVISSGQRKEHCAGSQEVPECLPLAGSQTLWGLNDRVTPADPSCSNTQKSLLAQPGCRNLFFPCHHLLFHSETSYNFCGPKCLRQRPVPSRKRLPK